LYTRGKWCSPFKKWKGELLLVMKNDDRSSNLMDDGLRSEDEGKKM
jgi:hypothetical protein